MEEIDRVLICGASLDAVNHNVELRHYVADGFAEVLGEERVRFCSLEVAEYCAQTFNPQLIVVFGSCMPATSVYHGLRNVADRTGAHLVFWLHDDPYEFDFNYKILDVADIIFSNDRWTATHYQHEHVYHLPLAASQRTQYRAPVGKKDREVFFCGVGFPNRVSLLNDCAPHLSGASVEVFGSNWPSSIKFAKNERIDNALLPDYYARSTITLNMGRRYNLANSRFNLDASTPGPRTFEAAMAGTVQCMFVEGLEILDYYEPDKEILLFDTAVELKQHVERLRDEPQLAAAIATASQVRTIADHTYAQRAKRILSVASELGP